MSTKATNSHISREEELNLIRQFRTGDPSAANQLTAAYAGYVAAVAREYQNRGLDMPELQAAGTDGLLRAAPRFDETRDFRFLSYAVWWVRQSILQSLANQNIN
jgi:RNA polymerase primary sigma factor